MIEVKTCPSCETVNTPDSRFCKACGSPLAVEEAPSESTAAVVTEVELKVQQIEETLAGLDCGRCGYQSCRENALAIIRGESPPNSCVQGGEEAARKIREILGIKRPWQVALWEGLTSIKLAIGLILAVALLSIVGTVIPQGQPDLEYLERYGLTGYKLITFFRADELFHTWYFLGLLGLVSLNTLACTLKRLRTSWEFLSRPIPQRSPEEVERLPTSLRLELEGQDDIFTRLESFLRSRRYRVAVGEGRLSASKNLFGRLGVDVFHVSLLVVLLGAIIGGANGLEDFKIAHKGEVFEVPRGGFSVRVDDLWTVNYEDTGQIKDWYTKLTVIEDGREVLTKTIEVNHPLTYKGISFYQASFGSDWSGAAQVVLRAERASDGESLGEFTAEVTEEFELPDEGVRVQVITFLPDFALNSAGQAFSRTQRLLNPAVYLGVYRGDKLEYYTWTFARPDMQEFYLEHFGGDEPYHFFLVGMTAPQFTGLRIASNPGIPLIYLGFALMGLGLFLNFYFPPRRIWAAAQDRTLYIGGLGRDAREFEAELERIAEAIGQERRGL